MDIRMSALPADSCGNGGHFIGKGTMPPVGPQVTLDMNSHPPVLHTPLKISPARNNSSYSRGVGKLGGRWMASFRNMCNSIASSTTPVTWVNPDLVPQFEPRPVYQSSPMEMPFSLPGNNVKEPQKSPLWYQAPPGSHCYDQDPLHIYNMISESHPLDNIPSQKSGVKKSSQPLNPEAKEWIPRSLKNIKDVSSNPPGSYFKSNVQKPLVIATAVSVGFVEITEKEINEVRDIIKNDIPKIVSAPVENKDISQNITKMNELTNTVGKVSKEIIQKDCSDMDDTEVKSENMTRGSDQAKDTLTYASITRKSPEPPQKCALACGTDTSTSDVIKQPLPKIFMKDKKYPKEKAPPLMENRQRELLPFRTGSRMQKRSSRKFLKDLKDHSPAKSDSSFSESGSSIDSNLDIICRLGVSNSPSSSTIPSPVSPRDKFMTLSCSTPRDRKLRRLSDSSGSISHNRTTSECSTVSGESVDIEFKDEESGTGDSPEANADGDKVPIIKHPNSIIAHILGLDSDSEESEEETDDDWDDTDGDCTTFVLDDSWETFGLVFQPPTKSLSSGSKCGDVVDDGSEVNVSNSDICDNSFNEHCNNTIGDVNKCWELEITKDIKTSSPCRVKFGEIRVHPMVSWTFAYKNARRGPWEQYARDRVRFNNRIEALEPVLSSVLESRHREAMYQKIYGSNGTIN